LSSPASGPATAPKAILPSSALVAIFNLVSLSLTANLMLIAI
jgi:hypothetical protein